MTYREKEREIALPTALALRICTVRLSDFYSINRLRTKTRVSPTFSPLGPGPNCNVLYPTAMAGGQSQIHNMSDPYCTYTAARKTAFYCTTGLKSVRQKIQISMW